MSQQEIWSECPLHRGYEVSANGLVRRKGKSATLKPWKVSNSRGYLEVALGRKVRCTVHRLVAATYLGLDASDPAALVCHKDDDPLNNRVENLYIGTKSSNQNDFNRLRKERGEKHPNYVHGKYADQRRTRSRRREEANDCAPIKKEK